MIYSILDFKLHNDNYGSLVPIEASIDIPFEIRRVYYIFNVNDKITRGFHAHKNLNQILIAVSGSVDIILKSEKETEIIKLSDPSKGLMLGPMIWREMTNFTKDAVLLVLASEYYEPSDYVRDFDIYIDLLNGGKI